MGRVARKQHAPVLESVHTLAGKSVDAGPFQGKFRVFEGRGIQHGAHAGDDVLRLLLCLGVGIPAQLKVDAPHAIGLHVQQHALVAVELGVKPKPALGGEVHLHLHIGDQKAVFEDAAFALLPQQLARGGA